MVKRSLHILLFFLFPMAVNAQDYHSLCNRDTADYGQFISRTLALLAESTPSHPYDVNIIVYGQSVSKQEWWIYLKEKIRTKFPYARIHMINKSVGGFASQKLWKTTEYDILPFYPDLVIFHVFGSHYDYEKILQMIRSRTSAEMLVWNDPWTGPNNWSDTMSFHLIPSFCDKYKLEFANVRTGWIDYLHNNGLTAGDLLTDGDHLNEPGNRLLADMLFRYFNYDPSREADPYHLVDSIVPDKIYGPGPLSLRFTGNRADIQLYPPAGDTSRTRVLIDKYHPSEFMGIYYISRPNADSTKDWPWQTGAIIHTSNHSPLICEKWTVTLTETDDSLRNFRFRIFGSLTGFDGTGTNTEKFISNSGRVIIEPEDWFLKEARDMFNINFNPGYTITWDVNATFADYTDNSEKLKYTLVQGVENRSHILKLSPYGHKNIPVERIIIYKPFLIQE